MADANPVADDEDGFLDGDEPAAVPPPTTASMSTTQPADPPVVKLEPAHEAAEPMAPDEPKSAKPEPELESAEEEDAICWEDDDETESHERYRTLAPDRGFSCVVPVLDGMPDEHEAPVPLVRELAGPGPAALDDTGSRERLVRANGVHIRDLRKIEGGQRPPKV
eukprot:m.274253 g.274253  ORF g.274253 m.274253 type:complete len:165 (-) comp26895_c2_seq10:6537-7031(-)